VRLVGLTNVVCQVGLGQRAVAAALTAPDPDADVAAATAVWRDRAEAIAGQLRDYPLVRPNGGWPLLAGTARLGLTRAEAPPGCSRVAGPRHPDGRAGPGRVPAGDRYLRPVFAGEPVERLAGLRDRFAAAVERFGQPAGCQRRNAAPWSSTHSASSPYGLRPGSPARPPAARTRSTAAAMSSTR
jgi:hypothetical protein